MNQAQKIKMVVDVITMLQRRGKAVSDDSIRGLIDKAGLWDSPFLKAPLIDGFKDLQGCFHIKTELGEFRLIGASETRQFPDLPMIPLIRADLLVRIGRAAEERS